MQVPNVLDSLRNNEEPSYIAPFEWTAWTAVWEDELELFGRLKDNYTKTKTPEAAKYWSAYVENRRPIDWSYCMDFFLQCPPQYQTQKQLDVAALEHSADPHISAMQLLYRYHTGVATYDTLLLETGALQHLEMHDLSTICKDVWDSSSSHIVANSLPPRLSEFFKTYPHSIDTEELPQHGVGILMATMLIGVNNPSFGINIGEDERYYNAVCQTATDSDILKIIECHQKNPEWRKRMQHEFEIKWFDPFVKSTNPDHLWFTIYQSLDPGMNLKQLSHFIKQKKQAPAESYSLESISIS